MVEQSSCDGCQNLSLVSLLNMPAAPGRKYERNDAYRLRLLYCTVGTIAFLIAIFKLWPLPGTPASSPFPYHTGGQELIALEEVQPTRQSTKPPPPPPPVIPLIVPDDIVIQEEVTFEDSFLKLEEYGDDLDMAMPAPPGGGGTAVAPETAPKPVRFVEPEFPRAAQRKNVKAEVVVEVFVDDKGQVLDAKIVDRFLYSKNNKNKKAVPDLGYGLEESALSAAQRWTFRPAMQNGLPVKSYHTITFSFGV